MSEASRPRRRDGILVPAAGITAGGGPRVLFLLASMAMGGSERNVVALVPGLQAAGIDVTLCTLTTNRDSSPARDLEATTATRLDIDARRLIDPRAWWRLRRLLTSGHFDVLHTEDLYAHIMGTLAARATGVPVVMTRHVLREDTPTGRDRVRSRLDLFGARRGTDRIIAVSEVVRRQFSKDAGVALSRIETIHNGIDFGRFTTAVSTEAQRRHLGWPIDKPVVVMVGVLRRGKGHEVLLQAVPAIRAAVGNVSIKVVGAGERDAELRQLAEALGDTVEFLGERDDIPAILNASDVLVLPSWSEALPTVLIEAGASGIPVVATRVGGAEEIVIDGETGFLIEPGDVGALTAGVVTLLEDARLADRMGTAARTFVTERFSLDRQADATAAIYRSVIKAVGS